MNMSLLDLLIQADDMPVNLSLELKLQSSPEKDRQLIEFISLFKKLTTEQQSLIIFQIKGILANQDQPEKTYVIKIDSEEEFDGWKYGDEYMKAIDKGEYPVIKRS